MQDREAVGETLWLRSARPVVETKQTDAQTQTNYQAFCYSSPKKVTFQYYPEQSITQKYRKTMAQSVSDKVVQTDQEKPLSLFEFGNDIETNAKQNTSSLYLNQTEEDRALWPII